MEFFSLTYIATTTAVVRARNPPAPATCIITVSLLPASSFFYLSSFLSILAVTFPGARVQRTKVPVKTPHAPTTQVYDIVKGTGTYPDVLLWVCHACLRYNCARRRPFPLEQQPAPGKDFFFWSLQSPGAASEGRLDGFTGFFFKPCRHA